MNSWNLFEIIMTIVLCNTISIIFLVSCMLRMDNWSWTDIGTAAIAISGVTVVVMLISLIIYTGDIKKCTDAGGTFLQGQMEATCITENIK